MAARQPVKLRTYVEVHRKWMDLAVRSGFVCEHTLHGFERIETGFLLEGEIACLGEIVITVYKELEIVGAVADDFKIQTRRYAYNASVRGFHNFLRYDDAHEYPGHHDRYHRHDFDWRTGHELPGSPRWIGLPSWPMLSDFINFVREWHEAHRSELPNPDRCPKLGARSGDDDPDAG